MTDCVVRISGNVAAEPQIRHTGSGVPVATLRVGWSERWVDRQTGEWRTGPSSFLTISCWRRLAENVINTLNVGDPVIVEGRLSLRSYRDAQGEERSRWEVDATRVGPDLARTSAAVNRRRSADAQPLPSGAPGSSEATGSTGVAGDRGHFPASVQSGIAAEGRPVPASGVDWPLEQPPGQRAALSADELTDEELTDEDLATARTSAA